MSLVQIPTDPCPQCSKPTPRGKHGEPRYCRPCINKRAYEKRRLLLKLKRLKQKKCHSCGGFVEGTGVFCTPYCRWIKSLTQRHYVIITKVGDL